MRMKDIATLVALLGLLMNSVVLMFYTMAYFLSPEGYAKLPLNLSQVSLGWVIMAMMLWSLVSRERDEAKSEQKQSLPMYHHHANRF